MPEFIRMVEERSGQRPHHFGFTTARAKDVRFYPWLYFADSALKVLMTVSLDTHAASGDSSIQSKH